MSLWMSWTVLSKENGKGLMQGIEITKPLAEVNKNDNRRRAF